jgi:hypothetical protein
MATAPVQHETTSPRPSEPSTEQRAYLEEPGDVPADRTAMLFWVIAFVMLAVLALGDLVLSLFR